VLASTGSPGAAGAAVAAGVQRLYAAERLRVTKLPWLLLLCYDRYAPTAMLLLSCYDYHVITVMFRLLYNYCLCCYCFVTTVMLLLCASNPADMVITVMLFLLCL
jgi:hypothetical protein